MATDVEPVSPSGLTLALNAMEHVTDHRRLVEGLFDVAELLLACFKLELHDTTVRVTFVTGYWCRSQTSWRNILLGKQLGEE